MDHLWYVLCIRLLEVPFFIKVVFFFSFFLFSLIQGQQWTIYIRCHCTASSKVAVLSLQNPTISFGFRAVNNCELGWRFKNYIYMNTLTKEPILDKRSKHRKDMKPGFFKLVTDLAASSGKVLLGTISLLKWNNWTHVEKENNCTASHTRAARRGSCFDHKMKMHQRRTWFQQMSFKGSESVSRSNQLQLSLQNFFRCFFKCESYYLKMDYSDIVETVRAQQCCQKNSSWSFWTPCHPTSTFLII